MQLHEYDETDPGFIDDLRESKQAVVRAAEWLSELGYPVIYRPTFERPSAEQMAAYSDSGDLEIVQRVEVKRRKELTFTSKEDFPFPTIIVDVCHTYDKARPKPYAYIIFNRDMTCCFVVECKTRPHWTRVTKRDRFKGRDRNFYECPVKHARFVRMPSSTQEPSIFPQNPGANP